MTPSKKISKLKEAEKSLSKILTAGFVALGVKAGDKVKCINDETYVRQYGSGGDWKVPSGVKKGKTYKVVRIAEDYFGSNKLVLEVGGKEVVVSPLYMDGAKYEKRFEKVGEPNKEVARVI